MTMSIRIIKDPSTAIPSRFSTVAWSTFQSIFAFLAYDELRALHFGRYGAIALALSLAAVLIWIELSGVARRRSFQIRVYSDDLELGPEDSAGPPRQAIFLLLLLPKKNREHLIGDLEEEFRTIVFPRYGRSLAIVWYWWHVTITLGPPVWAKLRRALAVLLLWRNLH
jgi:hypothetical protein